MKNNSYTVAVLGAGNIGAAVIDRLLSLDNEVVNLNLSKVLVSDISKDRGFDKNLLTDDFNEILNDESVEPVSYTHLRAPRDQRGSRMPSSA